MQRLKKVNRSVQVISGSPPRLNRNSPYKSLENNAEMVCTLRQIPLFRGIDDGALYRLARRTAFQYFRRGQYIFIEGDILKSYGILISGSIKAFKQTPFGKFVTISLLRKGETFGDMALIDGKPLSVSAVALENTTIISIDRVELLELVMQNPSLMTGIIVNIARRFTEAQERMVDLAAYDIKHRIPRILCELFQKHGDYLLLTHQEIADMAGTNRENVSRVLGHLRSIGALEVKRGKLTCISRIKL